VISVLGAYSVPKIFGGHVSTVIGNFEKSGMLIEHVSGSREAHAMPSLAGKHEKFREDEVPVGGFVGLLRSDQGEARDVAGGAEKIGISSWTFPIEREPRIGETAVGPDWPGVPGRKIVQAQLKQRSDQRGLADCGEGD
jgi:hypothetical protein